MTSVKKIYSKLTYSEITIKRNSYYDEGMGLIQSYTSVDSQNPQYIASPTIMVRKNRRALKHSLTKSK